MGRTEWEVKRNVRQRWEVEGKSRKAEAERQSIPDGEPEVLKMQVQTKELRAKAPIFARFEFLQHKNCPGNAA